MIKQEQRLRQCLDLIKAGDYKAAFDLCQKTWQHDKTPKTLEGMFKDSPLKDYKIKGWENVSNSMSRHHVELQLGEKKFESKVNMICETWPFKTHPSGDWGMNPISLLKVEPLKTKEPNPEPELKNQDGETIDSKTEVPNKKPAPKKKSSAKKKPATKSTTKKADQ